MKMILNPDEIMFNVLHKYYYQTFLFCLLFLFGFWQTSQQVWNGVVTALDHCGSPQPQGEEDDTLDLEKATGKSDAIVDVDVDLHSHNRYFGTLVEKARLLELLVAFRFSNF